MNAYNGIKNVDIYTWIQTSSFEIGYVYFSYFFSSKNISNQLYTAIISLVIVFPLSVVWYRNSKIPLLSIFIYITLGFFVFSFSGIRQAIAISIIFYGFLHIQNRKFFRFVFFVALAMLFHYSAVIFIFAYPLYYFRMKKVYLMFVPVLFSIIFIFKTKIFLFLYYFYKGAPGEIESSNAYTMLLVMIVIYGLSIFFGDSKNKRVNAYSNFLLVTIFVQIFASESPIIMRIGYYYYIFITLLIPEVIYNLRSWSERIIAVLIIVVALVFFFQMALSSGYLDITPYRFYWQ